MTFHQKLNKIVKKNNSLLCIGLDPVLEKLPKHLLKKKFPFFVFNKTIIDATHDLVCAYKPNSAFYEALGDRGVLQLKMTCDYIRETYPEIPIILDFKRADIGSTNEGYAKFAFHYIKADAATLNPYFGKESLEAFLKYREKGLFILCHTSNPGAGEFQEITIKGEFLYKYIAKKIVNTWNTHGNCMIVAGATFPKELGEIRKTVGDTTILAPGIGAQDGEIKKIIRVGLNSQKKGLIINASRSIVYASSDKKFAQLAIKEAMKLRDTINSQRTI